MKKQCFFENAKLLNEWFEIVPLMYGSLGLEYITNENLNADDIDILIPDVFIKERWGEFKSFLISQGYVLIDEHEHTFEKNGIAYSYASIEELEKNCPRTYNYFNQLMLNYQYTHTGQISSFK